MHRIVLSSVLAAAVSLPATARAQTPSPLAGVWTLNRSLSETTRDLGFTISGMTSPNGGAQSGRSGGGGRGRRGSGGTGGGAGGGGNQYSGLESYEDARRVQLLTGEARNPPVRLTIVDAGASLTITNELGQSRSVHPNGKTESIEIQGLSFVTTAKRDADRVVIVYKAWQDREVRYTYSPSASPAQLIVEVEFLQHGAVDKAKLVYEPGMETTTTTPAAATAPSPPSSAQPKETFDTRPGAELRGLKTLGILVEDLGPTAVACGLNRDALETALAKRLRDGGVTVRTNSDDDSYVYVNVQTTRLSDGTCASRYDVFLYTHATASLSYTEKPVLVQVSLMHRGGIGTSAPAQHAAAVARGLENYLDLVIAQIRDANKSH